MVYSGLYSLCCIGKIDRLWQNAISQYEGDFIGMEMVTIEYVDEGRKYDTVIAGEDTARVIQELIDRPSVRFIRIAGYAIPMTRKVLVTGRTDLIIKGMEMVRCSSRWAILMFSSLRLLCRGSSCLVCNSLTTCLSPNKHRVI